MALFWFEQLYQLADGRREPLAVAGGADASVLAALRTACDRGWVLPYLAGDETELRRLASACGVDLGGMNLVNAAEPAATAVGLVRSGRAKLLMKGQISTPSLMKAVLDPVSGLRTGRTICQVVLMEIRQGERRFLLADTGICIGPTLEQKMDILGSAVEVAHALGEECPRVALMAATETVTESMPETVEAAEIQRRGQAGEFAGCVVRGPLSFDLAYAAEAAAKKKVHAVGLGIADVMVFPNLVSANLTVKGIMYTADCRFGGVLCGTACPVVFMSRADTAVTRLNSLALALVCSSHTPPLSPS